MTKKKGTNANPKSATEAEVTTGGTKTMAQQKFGPEVAKAISDWVEDTLANVECSIRHGAETPSFIVTEEHVSIPFTYTAAVATVTGVIRFDNKDVAAETIGHYAAECEDDGLLDQMIAIAESDETQSYLRELKEE